MLFWRETDGVSVAVSVGSNGDLDGVDGEILRCECYSN